MVDLEQNFWRDDFPALSQTIRGKRLAFLDSAASAQKPATVLDAVRGAFETQYANVHRGLYTFSQAKTLEFEAVRSKVADFIGAPDVSSIIFTRNSTEAINMVAQSWGRNFLKAGDEILVSEMEHHANFVPWHILKDQIGVVLKFIPVTDDGQLDLSVLPQLVTERTRLIAVTHVSNVLGTINPLKELIALVRKLNPESVVLVDGSQSVVHMNVDVADLDPDFFVFTGHKLYGPTGVGVLYGRKTLLEAMPPWQGGGDMIDYVSRERVSFAPLPAKFEAGTPAIAEVIGLGAAIDYVRTAGLDAICAWEKALYEYALERFADVDGVTMYGMSPHKAGILSFTLEGCPPADVAMILDQMGVAVRTGHHCCMPLMLRYGVEGTIRASIALYTDKKDIDQLVEGLHKARDLLA